MNQREEKAVPFMLEKKGKAYVFQTNSEKLTNAQLYMAAMLKLLHRKQACKKKKLSISIKV